MDIGRHIKAAREKAGMTQAQLAQKLGISFVGVSQWENGKRQPKLDTLRKIADALGCDWLDLVSPEDAADLTVDHVRGLLQPQPPAPSSRFDPQLFDAPAAPADAADQLPHPSPADRITAAFNQLNAVGQQTAAERVEELTEVPRYQKQKNPVQAKPEGQEGE